MNGVYFMKSRIIDFYYFTGTGNTLGLAFPVACQSTYLLVWEFLRALPECDGT